LTESAFHFWRREIVRRDDEQRETPSAPGEQVDSRLASQSVEPAFVPVTLGVSSSQRHGAIDIRLVSGQRLRVRDGCDRQLLADVIALLEGRSC
jgi:hypothetical protein